MASVHIPVLALALALPGCVVREVREIHYVQGESRATTEADVGAPGAIIAESQPPAPIVEDAGEPPDAGYAWVDGYWHWNGAEWLWIDGRWVPPMAGLYFVAPSYYTSGDECVYVPGRWQRNPDRGPRRVVRHDSGRTRYHGSWTRRRPQDDDRRPGHGYDHPGDDVWIGPAPRRDPAPAVGPTVREPSAPPIATTPAMDPFTGPRPAPPVSAPPVSPPPGRSTVGIGRDDQPGAVGPRAMQPARPSAPSSWPSPHQPGRAAAPPRPSAPSVSPPRASAPSRPSPAPSPAPPRPSAPSESRRHHR